MTEWQPIETVPRDGREVLVYRDDSRKVVIAGNFAHWLGNKHLAYTHWMPLPEPPKGE